MRFTNTFAVAASAGAALAAPAPIALNARTEESPNFGGVVVAPTTDNINLVTGTIVVPTVIEEGSGPPGYNYFGDAVVGIDNSTLPPIIFEAGVELDYTYYDPSTGGYGEATFRPFYQWFPQPKTFLNLTISAGDAVQVTVQSTSTTDGAVTVLNLSTGESTTENPKPGNALQNAQAVWGVQRAGADFVDFETLVYKNCEAMAGVVKLGLDGGDITNMLVGDSPQAEAVGVVTIESNSEMQITWVNPS